MPSYPITDGLRTVKLSAAGAGQVSVGPPSGTLWRASLAAVSTTSVAKASQCSLFLGSSSGPLTLIDATFLGNQASSGKVAGAPLYHGQYIWAVWAGADASSTATLQVYGIQVSGYRGAAR